MIGIVKEAMNTGGNTLSASVTSPNWTFLLTYTGDAVSFIIYYFTTIGGSIQGSNGPITTTNGIYINNAGFNAAIAKYAVIRMSYSDGSTLDSAPISLPY